MNLKAYFARIGYTGEATSTLETLRGLHRAHATSVPFENLTVLLGKPVLLDIPDIEAKIVGEHRGGYCFEQNGLFGAALEQIGFKVTRFLARPRLGYTRVMARTHIVLQVEVDGRPWLADVGFGGWGLLEPIPFVAGHPVQQGVWTFQLREDPAGTWVLECPQCPMHLDQYAITLDPTFPIDFEIGNHYCSTYPESRFVQTLTAQLPSPTERVILRNRELLIADAHGAKSEILPSEEAVMEVLAGRFGLRFPAGTSFAPIRNAS